jgi:peptidoglycan-associated lipoprotein
MKQTLKTLSLLSVLALAACAQTATEDDASASAGGETAGATTTTTQPLPPADGGAAGPVLDLVENTIDYFETQVGDRVLFGTDSAFLDADDQAILTFQADWMLRFPERTAVIEGHADERGTREYNLALGARRAQAVFDYLVLLGVEPNRLQVVSYGKERPISLCADEICWSQNRRGATIINPGAGS